MRGAHFHLGCCICLRLDRTTKLETAASAGGHRSKIGDHPCCVCVSKLLYAKSVLLWMLVAIFRFLAHVALRRRNWSHWRL